jgi:hypothetical protein
MSVLTTNVCDEESLPVFSFKEEAETFLSLRAPSQEVKDLRVR